MKFYKLTEITEEEYYAMTSDHNYEDCYQCVIPFNNALYIAIDEDEEELEIGMDTLAEYVEVQDEQAN